jgi:hypothetical protein
MSRKNSGTRRSLVPERHDYAPAGAYPLAAEFELLQPLDVFPLIGNDLGLPNEPNAEHAHNEDTYYKDEIFLRFGSRHLL